MSANLEEGKYLTHATFAVALLGGLGWGAMAYLDRWPSVLVPVFGPLVLLGIFGSWVASIITWARIPKTGFLHWLVLPVLVAFGGFVGWLYILMRVRKVNHWPVLRSPNDAMESTIDVGEPIEPTR